MAAKNLGMHYGVDIHVSVPATNVVTLKFGLPCAFKHT